MSSLLLVFLTIYCVANSWIFPEIYKQATGVTNKQSLKLAMGKNPAPPLLSQSFTITKDKDVQSIKHQLEDMEQPGMYVFNTAIRWNVQKTIFNIKINPNYPKKLDVQSILKRIEENKLNGPNEVITALLLSGKLYMIVVDVCRFENNELKKFAEVTINVHKEQKGNFWDIDHDNPIPKNGVKMIDQSESMKLEPKIICDALSYKMKADETQLDLLIAGKSYVGGGTKPGPTTYKIVPGQKLLALCFFVIKKEMGHSFAYKEEPVQWKTTPIRESKYLVNSYAGIHSVEKDQYQGMDASKFQKTKNSNFIVMNLPHPPFKLNTCRIWWKVSGPGNILYDNWKYIDLPGLNLDVGGNKKNYIQVVHDAKRSDFYYYGLHQNNPTWMEDRHGKIGYANNDFIQTLLNDKLRFGGRYPQLFIKKMSNVGPKRVIPFRPASSLMMGMAQSNTAPQKDNDVVADVTDNDNNGATVHSNVGVIKQQKKANAVFGDDLYQFDDGYVGYYDYDAYDGYSGYGYDGHYGYDGDGAYAGYGGYGGVNDEYPKTSHSYRYKMSGNDKAGYNLITFGIGIISGIIMICCICGLFLVISVISCGIGRFWDKYVPSKNKRVDNNVCIDSEMDEL